MRYATLQEERKLWQRGYRFVACIDEAGRGPLAGPVVACAVGVILKSDLNKLKSDLGNLRDSKKLSPKRREEIYKKVKERPAIQWGIGIVSEKIIDKINIYNATKLAMKKALEHLKSTLYNRKLNDREVFYDKVGYLILDGNMKLDVPIPQRAIVRADEKVFSCALASVIAKVTRDQMMMRYHKQYPQYGFDKHKGYGTKLHVQKLRRFGPCPIHRRTFAPLKNLYSVVAV